MLSLLIQSVRSAVVEVFCYYILGGVRSSTLITALDFDMFSGRVNLF